VNAYEAIVGFCRFVIRRWFRRVEVSGLEHLPADGGGILVSWHPNGMVDPGLIFTHFPRRVVFGARHGLFKFPVLGWMMKAVGTVPIFRAVDMKKLPPEERRQANARSLDALAEQVAAGSFSCLFPEGDSHDLPTLLQLKTGAARFYYRARQLQPEGSTPPVIIPVGLHYDSKRSFRSHALVTFHPPMTLPELLDTEAPELDAPAPEQDAHRTRCRDLTNEIDRVLREVVHATESWELHFLMHRARKLVRAERALRAGATLSRPKMKERVLGFGRIWVGYQSRSETHPEEVAMLVERVFEYDSDMRVLGIEDHELDRDPRLASPMLVLILLAQVLLVFLLLPPLLLVGYLVNAPAVLALWVASKVFSKKKKDEATIKVLLGAVLLPTSWLLAGGLAWWGHAQLHTLFPTLPETPWLAALSTVALGITGGMLAMRYLRLANETLRSVRVRLTRSRRRIALDRLRRERAQIYEATMQLIEGLELPGEVGEDGRIHSPKKT
jgi:1-acyl-sn-glycerol-3-phosphate acyltransferase